jgi:hypothetical protein
MPDRRHRVDIAAAVNLGRYALALAETEASTPLMMIGTPARPGMTMTGALSAQAAHAVPIKMASASAARMVWVPISVSILLERLAPRVKATGRTGGKPNA